MVTAFIGKLDHQRLSSILETCQQTISVSTAAEILKMSSQDAAKLLSRLTVAGLLKRIKRGVYLSAVQQGDSLSGMNLWLLAQNLFSSCYVGGYSAAKYWGLKEEGDDKVLVITTNKPRNHFPIINGAQFVLRTVSQEAMFGLQAVPHRSSKILISDPSKTMVDMLLDPRLGGGTIFDVASMLACYLKSGHRNVELLFDYAKQLRSGAVLKRLGFLLDQLEPSEGNIVSLCKLLKSEGYIKLDPQLGVDKLITRFGIWVPRNFKEQLHKVRDN